MNPGDRVKFTYLQETYSGVLAKKIGAPSDSYQWTFIADDGRDFVACDHELEKINE